MKIVKTAQSRLKGVDFEHLSFGEIFSDHMLSAEYKSGKWEEAKIIPYGPMEIHPAICSLHSGQVIVCINLCIHLCMEAEVFSLS